MHTRFPTPVRTGLLLLACALLAPMAFGQMPQGNTQNMLSSSDVSDAEIQKVASILASIQSATRQEQMKMRKDMMALRKKMASMDSTQKAEATRKMRKRQMTLRKKQAKIMQQEAKKEGINPKRVQRIMRSTRQDSTLQQRLRQAMKAKMKQQGQMGGGQEGGQDEDGGSSNP